MNSIVRHLDGFRWDGVPVLNYKEEGTHFKAISRQVLFEGGPKLGAELRYFEIEPGGHSTLERHDHIHSVMIIRGRGQCLVGDAVHDLGVNDLVYVPTMTWHQFRATTEEPLGFLCLVNVERDRPQRPDAAQTAELQALPRVGEFIRL
ncbi:MAG: cupin domain-containing protein [Verrucomicrobiota bacterium]